MTEPDGGRPSWMGAPGYTPPPPNLAPHAPMPGAPPYPANEEHPPPPVGEHRGTGYPPALLATLIWVAVDLVVVIAVAGPFASFPDAGRTVDGLLVPALVASLLTWLVVRRRGGPFWLVVLAAAPLYGALRLGFVLLSAVGS